MKRFYIKKVQSGDRVYHLNILRLALVLLILIALITVIVLAVQIGKSRAKKAKEAQQARIAAEQEQKKAEEEAALEKQRQEEAAQQALAEAEEKAQREEAEQEAAKPQVEARAIVIDAGHGGKDDGVTRGDVLEKEINLIIAKMVQQKLTDAGYTVIMTRTGDEFSETEDRVNAANDAHVDLYVAIHQNMMSSDTSVKGIETWFAEDDELAKELARAVQENVILQTDAKDRGIKCEQEMIVTAYADVPAAVLLCGFLSNDEECELLTSTDYQQKIAQGIADGIVQFLEEADLPASQYQFNS